MDKEQDKTVIHERRGASKKSPTIDQAYVLGGSYQDAVGSWGGGSTQSQAQSWEELVIL